MGTPAFWRTLEELPGLCAATMSWRRWLGSEFAAVNRAFLQEAGMAGALACPGSCGCAHAVVRCPEGKLAGICQCEPWRCDDIELTDDEVMLRRVNLHRVARGISRALELRPMVSDLGAPNTLQACTWSTSGSPIIVTVAHSVEDMRGVTAYLAATLCQRFALFAPTARHVDAVSRQVLAGVHAAFFPLETTVFVGPNGGFQPVDLPGRILAEFTPAQVEPSDGDVARRVFAIVQALDSGKKKPSLVTVFRLYCMENLDAAEVARQLGTSRATVVRRLHLIREKTGADPRALRRFSPHLDKVRESLADPRAARIRPRSVIEQEEEEDGT